MRRYESTTIITPLPLKIDDKEDCSASGPAFQRDRWYSLIDDYSSRFLTKESDKLPALAGLATRFNNEENWRTYMAGLWSEHLPSALLWRTKLPNLDNDIQATQKHSIFQSPEEHRASSWSWASIDGEVSYGSQRVACYSDHALHSSYGTFAIVRSPNNLTTAFDSLGLQDDPSLLLQGSMVEVNISEESIDEPGQAIVWRLVNIQGGIVGGIYPDTAEDHRPNQSIFVLSIRSELFNSYVPAPWNLYQEDTSFRTEAELIAMDYRMGLALTSIGEDGVYRRVGLVRWMPGKLFAGVEAVQFRLV